MYTKFKAVFPWCKSYLSWTYLVPSTILLEYGKSSTFKLIFILENRKKSREVKLREYGGWGTTVISQWRMNAILWSIQLSDCHFFVTIFLHRYIIVDGTWNHIQTATIETVCLFKPIGSKCGEYYVIGFPSQMVKDMCGIIDYLEKKRIETIMRRNCTAWTSNNKNVLIYLNNLKLYF